MSPIVRLLMLKKLTRRFGGVVALDSLDLIVHEGEVLGLIGPNGAGKTTAFNVVTGLYAPTEGDVIFKGKNLVGLKPSAVTSRGIARTFQNIRLFRGMTVLENVLVGRHCKMRTGPVGAIFRLPGMVAEERLAVAEAMELLEFTGIDAYASGVAEALSYGDQRRLEIARALASEPSLLLLDEPAAGMNPSEKSVLNELILAIRDRGVTILLIEHDMKVVMGISDRVVVLDHGEKIADGTPAEVRRDPKVLEPIWGLLMLELRDIHFYYGHIHALQGVSLEVRAGQVVCLIGNNGAGKSSTLMAICGVNAIARGEILLEGEAIHAREPDEIVRRGICQVPEGRRIFPDLTVLENLEMGAFLRNDAAGVKDDLDYVCSLFPVLHERRTQRGGTLSGGEQQMLAITRALMARPRLLLLDEPSLGLAPKIIETIFEVLTRIREEGTGIFLVEQNVHLALNFSDWAYVMETGRIVMGDEPDVLRDSPAVREAYLGE